jgi:hypothetical protein
MSAAEKYGRVQDLSAETIKQVADIGQKMRESGVTESAGTHTAAHKYGAPVARNEMGRALSQQHPGRSL